MGNFYAGRDNARMDSREERRNAIEERMGLEADQRREMNAFTINQAKENQTRNALARTAMQPNLVMQGGNRDFETRVRDAARHNPSYAMKQAQVEELLQPETEEPKLRTDYEKFLSDTGFKRSPETYDLFKTNDGESLTGKEIFDMEKDLRKEYQAESKDYKKVRDAYTRIQQSAKDPSPAGDLALIFNYMKVLDPGSVVRESEFRTAENAKSALERAKESGEIVPNFIWGTVNRLMTGQRMLDIQRKDFVRRAGMLYGGMEDQHKKRTAAFTGIADRNKLDIRNVTMDVLPSQSADNGKDPLGLGF